MKADVKERWVAALRSGEFKQGTGRLRDEVGGHCCLGVLCQLVNPEGWEAKKPEHMPWEQTFNRYKDSEEWTKLPEPLREEVEITDEEEKKLIVLNDVEATSFNGIADYIEENL